MGAEEAAAEAVAVVAAAVEKAHRHGRFTMVPTQHRLTAGCSQQPDAVPTPAVRQ